MLRSVILIASLLLFSHASNLFRENHVINIGEPTWGQAASEYSNTLVVFFYEPYCTPCREFWAEIIKAAESLSFASSTVQFGRVDCHDESKLCLDLKINTLPSLILYQSGHPQYTYKGIRTADALVQWARKTVEFQFEEVSSERVLFKRHSLAILLGRDGLAVKNAYRQGLQDKAEVARAGEELQRKLDADSAFATIYTQTGEVFHLNDGVTPIEIDTLVQDFYLNKKTAVPTWDVSWSDKLVSQGLDMDFVFMFRTRDYEPLSQTAKAFVRIAYERRSVALMQFFFVNFLDDSVGRELAKMFGVDVGSNLTVAIGSKRGKVLKKYRLEQTGDIDGTIIDQFIDGFNKGEVKRYYMSTEPSVRKNGYVKELTGNNFASVAGDPKKNVFVMFMKQWDEVSRGLDNIWQALAYRFRENQEIVIGRIDISQNDVDGFERTELPAFLLYIAQEKKEPIEYVGDRTLKGLKGFLVEHVPSSQDYFDL